MISHIDHVVLTVADIERSVAKTGAVGPIQSLYFNDPDGNLIEVGVYPT